MKFVVLAAMVGYVFGAATGEDCAVNTDCTDDDTYCDLTQDATTGAADDTGVCGASAANGATCSDAVPCVSTDYCATDTCTTKIADGQTCTWANGGDCQSGTCEGPCGATLTCGANANADGALGGCCSADVAVTDAANYCSADGVVTARAAGGAACVSGGCATGYSCDDTSNTCKGATGSACSAAVVKGSTTAWAGQCDADVEGSDTTCADTDNDANTDNNTCGGTACPDGETCAAGAVGGACNAGAAADPAADADAVECATATDTCTDAVCTAAADDGGDDESSEDSAAVFYGLSMVWAIAYLL